MPRPLAAAIIITLFLIKYYDYTHVTAASYTPYSPPISYFALTASLQDDLRTGARLSLADFNAVQAIASAEFDSLRLLEARSQAIAANPFLTLGQKRAAIAAMRYNPQVDAILQRSDLRLRLALSPPTYHRLQAWIAARWPYERARHGMAAFSPGLPSLTNPFNLSPKASTPRSYRIFATHYEAKKGAEVVALPDRCLKFSNGGLSTCAELGYIPGGNYTVILSYQKTAGALVGEAGPWNIDDNFWAGWNDPTPRRLFADLPVGMPEAQAAFYNGYNGGLDQYGRKVTGPYAIDLSRPVGDAIGLAWGKNDWVTVSFMWTADWGAAGAGSGGDGAAAIAAVTLSTPASDGSIDHPVQPGQTLWAIAVAYGQTIAQLQALNNLGEDTVIRAGQNLRVKPPGPTWTPQPAPSSTPASSAIAAATLEPSARRTARSERRNAVQTAGARSTQSVSLLPASTTPPSMSTQIPSLLQATTQPLSPASSPIGMRAAGYWLPWVAGFFLMAGLFLWVLGGYIKRQNP